MYDKSLVNSLFEKAKTKITSVISLDELAYGSFDEFCKKVGDTLNYTESQLLYGAAEEAYQYKTAERRKRLVRANPQLQQAKSLDIQPLESHATEKSSHRTKRAADGTNKGDEDRLLNRDHQYVPAGHVASMFSPAAYLAELCKNARYLHDDENARSLKKRRPDLVELVLNQDNLDNEVSLLSLSNEILFKGCQRHAKMASKEGLLKKIAGERLTGSTPYHHAFQTLRYAIRYGKSNANDILATLSQLSYIKPDTHQASIGLLANIDPELYKILIEEVTEQNVDALFEKNFGTKWTPAQSDKQMGLKDQNNVDFYQSLCHTRKLADYYDMREDLVEKLIPKISKPLEKHGFYVNDKLTTFTQSSSKVFVETIVRTNLCSHTTYGGNGGTLHYANLIPKGENKYKLIIKPKAMNYPETESFDRLVVRQLNDLKSPPTIIEASSKDTIKYDNTKYGEGSSNEIVVDNLELKNGDRFTVQRATESGGLTSCYWGDFRFSIRQGQDVRFFLLELNKLLRLSKATSLSPTEIERIILAHNTEMNVDASVIASLFGVVRYKRRYNLSTEEAVILCGASISQHPVGEIRSQFDRLFNPLPLNKNNLTPDNKLGINFNPDDKDNQDWKSVLKQAFQVNDDALLFMAGSEKCTLSLSNLTQLYFIHLLARVHDLTINQTVMLLKILGYNPEDKNKWKPNNFTTIVEVVYQATQWLSEEALTVEQLFLMTTTTFSSQQTPQMTTLVKELRYNKTDDKALYTAMSRSVATALGISNLNVTENILIWLDTVTPTDKLNCKQFIEESKSEESKTTIKLSDKMIDFCQRVGQLAMIVQWLKLDELETTLIARYPKKVMGDSVTSIPVTLTAFRQLSHLRRFLSQCRRSAPAVTTALVEDNLTLDLLAGAIGEEKNTRQAAGQQHIDAKISDFSKINDILHVLYLGKALGVSPLVVQSLQSLTYDSNYQNIQWVADSLLAGLEASARQSVNNALEENLSAALSAYYIRSVLPGKGVSWVNSRDDLYQYLLIDNQVSSDTKTSPISAAITSIQLYVNNCLYGQEADVSVTGRVRPFFADWARCNKRYSQWAAVKQLIYFPENYLDPTQRVGQTGMMDKLLQSLNQGPLNKDTVEDAFKTYLTDFEQIANLSVITGYHDGLNTDRGLTYFIGATQAEPVEYYWRTVDQSQRKDGKFPASAWGEWKKIDTALQPMGELIRPVMFNSRLHILWVERQQKAEQKNGATTPFFDYAFKLAYLRHDGTWSTPFNFPFSLNGNLKACEKATASVNDLSLYCAPWFSQDKLIIIIYKKDWILNKENKKEGLTLSGEGLFVTQDMTHTQMGEKDITSICTAINTELSTKKIRRINNQYDDVTASSITDRNNYQWGDYNLSMIYGSSLEGIKLSSQESAIKVTLSPVIRIIHNGHEGLARHQCNLMKKYGQMGDKFLIFNQINKNPDHATADATIVPIVQYKGNKSNNAEERFLFYTDVSSANNARVWVNQKRDLHLISTSDHYGCIKDDKNSPEDYKNYIFMTFHDASKKYAIDIMNPIEIDTTIKSSSITMTMEFGTTKESRVDTTWSPDNLEESTIRFSEFDIDIPDNLFINNRVDVKFTFSAKAKDGRFVGSETFIIPITRKVVGIENVMSLHTTADGAQYLELQCYRTRLNTLFAKQLLSRANRGIDAILSLSTQKLPEHQLGEGTYATITLKKYDPDIYGTNKTFNLWFCDVYKPGDKFSICGGELSEYTTTAIKIFLPRLENAVGNPDNLYLSANYQKGPTPGIRLKLTDTSNPHGWVLDKTYNDGTFSGLENVSGLDNINEVMDFTGSNTLYFWEMFYYVPMLVTRRLLQEQQFDEAARWLRYVYSPDGYTIYGQHDARHWNTRPLLEDTGWNAVPENFTDPDALAQHDPMHYKLAAVMCQLDLLIARGDVAYRMLERDTLAEAMVWYQQALLLLGHAPSAPSPHHWTTPALAVINEAEFSPQENARLKSYRQTLAQRIYNLRHNLNIDGQPLFLPLYAKPANPQDLRSALVVSTGSSPALPKNRTLSLYRFPLMLERARSMVSQLSQFGSLLSNILERQDAEALSALMQNQAKALFMMSAGIQNQTLEELIAEKEVLVQQQTAARQRLEHYQGLYEENINAGENDAMATRLSAGHKALTATGLHIVAAGLDLAPNIFGLSVVGGSRWGALATAGALGANIWSSYEMNNADNTTLKESYRRRREEWDIQRKTAQTDVNQLEAQMKAHDIRCEAAVMQKTYLETQQKQAQEQLEFLQRKFSNQALYSWLRGRLSAIYYQFYDLTMSRCLMAEAAYHYEVKGDPLQTPQFIKPGAWQSAHAGLLCGEALTLNLAQMENDYLKWESRALEVTRTVCLSEVYAAQFTLSTKVVELVNKAEGTAGNGDNTLKFNDNQLQATLKLSDLKMNDDYPANLGQVRRIKQISVTLPALVGPYQDVRAVLSYEGSLTLPRGCRSLAVSHGMNDNGQFQLDFNDGKFLPFESIPVNDSGVFTLSFPQATDKQKALLLSLSDIILHIRYTIRD